MILYLLTYVLLSFPGVHNGIKNFAQQKLSELTGGKVEIESLNLSPFNEAVIEGLEVLTPEGQKLLYVERIGAGISIYRLLTEKKIELTYGEIIGLHAYIEQKEKDGPYNFQFLIDAFSKKDDKPSKDFELSLKNVVLRKSFITINRAWTPENNNDRQIDFNHFSINDLRADITFPKISNKELEIDLRRLALNINDIFEVDKVGFIFRFGERELALNDFVIELPETILKLRDIRLKYENKKEILTSLNRGNHQLEIYDSKVTPSDFSSFFYPLNNFVQPLDLHVGIKGRIDSISISNFYLFNPNLLALDLNAKVEHLTQKENIEIDLKKLGLRVSKQATEEISSILNQINPSLFPIISKLGELQLDTRGGMDLSRGNGFISGELSTGLGNAEFEFKAQKQGEAIRVDNSRIALNEINLDVAPGLERFGKLDALINFDGKYSNKVIDGNLSADIYSLKIDNSTITDITLNILKEGDQIDALLKSNNEILDGEITLDADISKENKGLIFNAFIDEFNSSIFKFPGRFHNSKLQGEIFADLKGEKIEDMVGEIRMDNFKVIDENGETLELKELRLEAIYNDKDREINLSSDWVDGTVMGNFTIAQVVSEVKEMLHNCVPAYFPEPNKKEISESEVEFSFYIKENESLQNFLRLPVKLLTPASIEGEISGKENETHLAIDIPFIQQGTNKLIYDTNLYLTIDNETGEFNLKLGSVVPVKNGDLNLNLNFEGKKDNFYADLSWKSPIKEEIKGSFAFDAFLWKEEFSKVPFVHIDIKPSEISLGAESWFINPGTIDVANEIIEIRNFKIWHDNQFVEIAGVAGKNPHDILNISLEDIDVDYVFDTLKINYVTFGGTASGEIRGSQLLSGEPIAATKKLWIKNLSYNGCVIGDGDISSHWDNEEKEVSIKADIYHDGNLRVAGDGGVWVTRDSLDFKIKADKVPVGFVQPFMQAFSSDVGGLASGEVELGGSFKDIDLIGKIFADSVSVKLDYTNTYYHGSDSVILDPGKIIIPNFKLFDKNGNSMLLTGELTHQYFHEPAFTFRVTEADHILCYDTNSTINPDWYGTLYGSGNALVTGYPGFVRITADMSVVGNSSFTFVLNETLAAADYNFLTFTDKKKEELLAMQVNVKEDILSRFKKKVENDSERPSDFEIGIMATVTPQVLFTLVMDPKAGDKILARGSGAIQVEYESETDEMSMFGKYTLDEGSYNFSLQDLILRDFKIQPGSSISFNGDPLKAMLDIAATYRVNTNLSDLDKSFESDRDLARTNVPVDAVLMVKGDTQHPEISFDIELPTLTQDVERKVKSIISTEDMMNRQIIYLLALNRFYTPEYMGSTSNGGELTAVASTTLSSQLSNMLGQLTDKFTVSPSFRSDKGDFSDLEVDVALSSRLLNNRLLVNGNFGYRDKNNSSTTFVGDFDIEYLLSKNGNLRLKAYNHFNDQNYYLREALTTQGLGVIYRRDFDDPFTFLKRKKKELKEAEEVFDSDYENMIREEENEPIEETRPED